MVNFDYTHDLENAFDYAYLYAEYPGQPLEELASFTGYGVGNHNVVFTPPQTGPFTLFFRVVSDGSYSDEDGLFTTTCGAFAFDGITVNGGGNSYSADFETGNDGWTLRDPPPGPGGEYSDIVPVSAVDSLGINCSALSDTVLIFADDNGQHTPEQSNSVLSPWIDLEAVGVQDEPIRFVEMDIFADLPLENYTGIAIQIQYYPELCGGVPTESEWIFSGTLTVFDTPECGRWSWDLTNKIPLGAERVRIGVGVSSLCSVYSCAGPTNSSPWIDNIRFGTAKNLLTGIVNEKPSDAFPTDGTLGISSTARVDRNLEWTEKDTLVVRNTNHPIGGQEVEVVFAVDPGPGINGTSLTNWLTAHAFVESARGRSWYSARMDTAEIAGVPDAYGRWMTCYHEDDPNFSGSDTAPDPAAPDELLNDIFPDDLFTLGTRLNLYYRARSSLLGNVWTVWPDTAGGNFLEMEVLPSSVTVGGSNNSVLYVNGFSDHDARPVVEEALGVLLSGGSANAENTAWDRFDHFVLNENDAASIGTAAQLDAYETIIWNCGDDRGVHHLDATLLESWLTAAGGPRNLYLSGTRYLIWDLGTDGGSMESLLTGPLGTQYICRDITKAGCPPGALADNAACFVLAPEDTARVANTPSRAETMRMFPVIGFNTYRIPAIAPRDTAGLGTPSADERYIGNEIKHFASVVNEASGGASEFRTVLDAGSVHLRFQGPDCSQVGQVEAATHRLREVFTFFGHSVIGVPEGSGDLVFPFRLGASRPNPFSLATEVRFELRQADTVKLTVFDIQGRMVRTLVDERMDGGLHTVAWDGLSDAGQEVPAGMYFYKLATRESFEARKVVVVR